MAEVDALKNPRDANAKTRDRSDAVMSTASTTQKLLAQETLIPVPAEPFPIGKGSAGTGMSVSCARSFWVVDAVLMTASERSRVFAFASRGFFSASTSATVSTPRKRLRCPRNRANRGRRRARAPRAADSTRRRGPRLGSGPGSKAY